MLPCQDYQTETLRHHQDHSGADTISSAKVESFSRFFVTVMKSSSQAKIVNKSVHSSELLMIHLFRDELFCHKFQEDIKDRYRTTHTTTNLDGRESTQRMLWWDLPTPCSVHLSANHNSSSKPRVSNALNICHGMINAQSIKSPSGKVTYLNCLYKIFMNNFQEQEGTSVVFIVYLIYHNIKRIFQ